MGGQITGVDVGALLARPSARDADPEVLEMLLVAGEAGLIEGAARAAEDTGED